MKLNLKNPIVFFDLETTGTSINVDRIVEICYLKVHPNGNEEAKTLRINPEMHIPEGASAVHGIYDKDVADCPTFKEVARTIANDIEGCDLAGFNSNRFDIPVLAEEFLRADVDIDLSRRKFVDVQVIFHKLEQRTLSAAYKFYCGKNLEDAHTAAADTQATYEVLMAQLDRYSELQNDVAFLADYSSFNKNVDFAGRMIYDDNGVEVFNFKVEDYHTYYVGESCILVHNADYDIELISKNIKSKVANDEIDPPTERGRAPKSKKDGYSIEIHHDEQNPNGPFKEMTRTDHRLGVNYKKNHPNHTQKSKIDRTQWKYQQRKYWENEWDSGRWNIK